MARPPPSAVRASTPDMRHTDLSVMSAIAVTLKLGRGRQAAAGHSAPDGTTRTPSFLAASEPTVLPHASRGTYPPEAGGGGAAETASLPSSLLQLHPTGLHPIIAFDWRAQTVSNPMHRRGCGHPTVHPVTEAFEVRLLTSDNKVARRDSPQAITISENSPIHRNICSATHEGLGGQVKTLRQT